MTRTFDPELLNAVANHEEVRPLLGGEGPIDLGPVIANPQNYAFVSDWGGFVVIQLQVDRYEAHTIALPGASLKHVARFAREYFEFLFTHTNCVEVVTKVPESNRGAHALATVVGFEESFVRQKAWKGSEAISYRTLTLDRWLRVCSTALDAGKAFHAALEEAKRAKGSALPVHEDDELHDRWVGATALMARAGNVIKGVNAYNRWAAFSGYAPIKLLSDQPVVIDVQDAIVGLRNNQMEVLLCR